MPPIPIIPRKILFGNPSNVLPKISPDGKYLAYIAPKDDVLNIYLTDNPKDLSSAKAITNDKVRGIRNFWWSFDHQIVYPQDKEGDEGKILIKSLLLLFHRFLLKILLIF